MTNEIFLLIADFVIKISFNKSKLDFQRKKIQNEILQTYEGFLILKTPRKIHFNIIFADRLKYTALYDPKDSLNYFSVAEGNYKQSTLLKIFYQISLYQFQLLLRNIVVELLCKSTSFMLHASAINTPKGAILFSGPPGAGKSTAMKLSSSKFPALADDSVIIRKIDKEYFIYQTPITEKEDWIKKNLNAYNINRICFPIKSREFKFEKVDNRELIMQKLIEEFWTRNEDYAQKELKNVFSFASHFREFYFIHFAKEKEQLIQLIHSI